MPARTGTKRQAVTRKMKDIEAMGGARREGPDRPRLAPPAQNALGRELKAMYDQIVSEPVPERFIRLLDQLECAESGEGNRKPVERETKQGR